MNGQYTIYFPTLDKLWAFKLSLASEAYVIDVSKKIIKCTCSDLELDNAVNKFNGSMQTVKMI